MAVADGWAARVKCGASRAEPERWVPREGKGALWADGRGRERDEKGKEAGWAECREELGWTGICWAARDERKGAAAVGWVGLVGLLRWVCFFSFSSSFLFFFWFSNFTQTIEFKHEFEFNPSTQTNKTMHQHECTNNFKPRENFNYSWKKIKLNARLRI